MPILWRYLIRNYIKVFFLSIFVFISVLLIIRSQDIARFATLGSSFTSVVRFTLFQVPNILPIAFPISALIASFLLAQKLSNSEELTALRSSGLSISIILRPIRSFAIIFSLLGLIVTSELTPLSRTEAKNLLYETKRVNPLLLIKKHRLIKLNDTYVEMNMIQSGKTAKDVIFVFYNETFKRLNLFAAKKLQVNKKGHLLASNLSYITHQPSIGFDHLFIDNQTYSDTEPKVFWLLMNTKSKKPSVSQMPSKDVFHGIFTTKSSTRKKHIAELSKRISFAISIYSFTLLGLMYGIHIGRDKKRTQLKVLAMLTTFAFVCFLAARSFERAPTICLPLYLLPHLILIYLATKRRLDIDKGVEF